MDDVCHGTKRASEVEQEVRHGVTEFVVPAYYWTGGRLAGSDDVQVEEVEPRGTASIGFEIWADTLNDAMAAMTELCQENESHFVYFSLQLQSPSRLKPCRDRP